MSSPEPTPNQVEGAMPSPEPNPNQVEGACLALSLPLTRWRVLCRACPRVPPSHSAAPSPCCRPRYREVWADMGRYGQMWADVGRCGEIWGDVRRCGERCAQPLLPAEILAGARPPIPR